MTPRLQTKAVEAASVRGAKATTQGISSVVRRRSIHQAIPAAVCAKQEFDTSGSGAWATVAMLAALGGLTLSSEDEVCAA